MTMAGNATLGTNLIDQLLPMIDSLRGTLHPMFGVRAFRVYTVLRTWAGQMVGDGDFTDVVTELTPQPRIEQWDGYKWVLMPSGVHEDGLIRMTEVSLTYTHAELTGALDAGQRNQQFFFRLVDAYGQANEDRILRHSRPPFVDREKTMGWICWLMDMNVEDGTIPEIPAGM